jgi:hypothetical protein
MDSLAEPPLCTVIELLDHVPVNATVLAVWSVRATDDGLVVVVVGVVVVVDGVVVVVDGLVVVGVGVDVVVVPPEVVPPEPALSTDTSIMYASV